VVTTAELTLEALEAGVLGKEARLAMEVPDGAPRIFTGVVWFVEAAGTLTRQITSFRLGLVPRLKLLEHRKATTTSAGAPRTRTAGSQTQPTPRPPHRDANAPRGYPRTMREGAVHAGYAHWIEREGRGERDRAS
jgi:hypothetical protein